RIGALHFRPGRAAGARRAAPAPRSRRRGSAAGGVRV
ncbi:MAG: hypothetical protein AVDCRST_MAG88-202, partial [uncultured Thermomicrobiales bacterium]